MLKVQVSAPFFVSEKKLNDLIQMVGPVTVLGVAESDASAAEKTPRKPRATAAAATGGVVKRRGRPPKVETAPVEDPDAPVEEPDAPVEEPAAEEVPRRRGRPKGSGKGASTPMVNGKGHASDAPPPSGDELMERFSALIDKDYDAAIGVLEKFGVPRFSALPEAEYGAFHAELTAAGV